MFPPRLAFLLGIFLPLVESWSAPPEIVFLNPPKAALGAKLRLEGHGFAGTTQVTFYDLRWFRPVPTVFTVVSDEILEVSVPSSPAPYPFFEKLAIIVTAAGGATLTIPPDAVTLTGSNSPPASSVSVVKSGANITPWNAAACLSFLEPGAVVSNLFGGGNVLFVSAGATLAMGIGGGGNQAYVADGAIFSGDNAVHVPAVSASYVPALFEIGTPPPFYTLTQNITGTGSVVISPRQSIYYDGQTIQLSAVPADGFAFSQWTGPVSGSNRNASFTIHQNTTFTAAFVPGANLAVSAARGRVQVSPQMNVYPLETSVTITYTPDRGYEFDHWTGDVSSTDNPLTLALHRTMDIRGEAKDPSFGKLLWGFGEFFAPPFFGEAVWTLPAIGDDGTIYVGYFVSAGRSVSDGKLFAIRPDGTQKWVQPLYLDSQGFYGVRYPVLGDDGTVYVSVGPILYAFAPDGTALWTKSFGSTSDPASTITAPALGSDGTLYIGKNNGSLVAMDPDQQIRWEHVAPGAVNYSPSIAADGTIYIGVANNPVRALNPDGTLKWISSVNLSALSPIALSSTGDILFEAGNSDLRLARLHANGSQNGVQGSGDPYSAITISSDGRIFFGDVDGSIVALNSDLSIAWKDQPNAAAFTEAPLIGSDGTVYFTSTAADTHRFIAYNPDGTIMWENNALSQNAGNGNVTTALALDRNGVLYGGSKSGKFYAVQATAPLASGDWPKQGADYRNTNHHAPVGPATAPVITSAPQPKDVVAGQTLSLSSKTSGNPAPQFQWFLNGKAIPGATAPTLLISNVQPAHAGQYFVRATNSAGSAQSVPVTVNVLFSLDAQSTAGGSVSHLPEGNVFSADTSITLTATAIANYEFVGWSGSVSDTQNPLTISMDSNKSITASFVPTYTLVLSQSGLGSFLIDPQQTRYRSGQRVTISAMPGPGYGFGGWGGALSGATTPASIVMDGDKSVSAAFLPLRNLTVQTEPGGSVSRTPDQAAYLNDTLVTLTAVRQPGYDFTGWIGDVQSRANPLLVTLNRDTAIVATFGPVQPPVVAFTAPANLTVTDRRFSLLGQVADNESVASVRWERDGQAMGPLSLTDGQFATTALNLREGSNLFRVIAADNVGNETVGDLVVKWVPAQTLEVIAPAQEREGVLISVPIRLISNGTVSGIAFTLTFDPTYLKSEDFAFASLVSSPFNQVNRATPGRIRASIALVDTIAAGPVDVGYALFRLRSVPADLDALLEMIEISTSNFSGDSLNDSTAVHAGQVRILKRAVVGDINANGRLDVGDASLLQRLITGIETPRPWDISINDLNGSATLDIADVQRLLSTAAGIFPQPPSPGFLARAIPLEGVAAAASPETVRLIADRQTAAAGQQVVVRVMIENLSAPLTGASFFLDYPKDALRLINSSSHTTGPLLPPSSFATIWNVFPDRNNYATQAGTISLAASSVAPASSSAGTLAEFTFEVQPAASDHALWPVVLRNIDLTSDGFTIRSLSPAQFVFNGWPLRFSDWKDVAFRNAVLTDPEDKNPDRDPDHDGLNNRLEYELGLDPLLADAGQAVVPIEHRENGTSFLAIAFDRRRDAVDTQCRVEVSRDLINWFFNGDGTAQTSTVETCAVNNPDGTEHVIVRSATPISEQQGPRFMRVTVFDK